jgi:hypothetical protein
MITNLIGRKSHEYHKILSTLACVLLLGQALVPIGSAQTNAYAAESDPVASISTGQLRGGMTSNGAAVFKNIPFAQPKWPKFDGTKRAYLDFIDDGPVVKEGLRRDVCNVFMENERRTSKD